MKKFIVIYHAPKDAMEQTAGMSKEDQAKGMQAWMTWAKNCGDKLVDLGFDSLMFVELQAAVEDAGGRIISPDT